MTKPPQSDPAPLDFEPPAVLDPTLVGSYSAVAMAGGGFVWDAVLEYRVWCHPHDGAPDDRPLPRPVCRPETPIPWPPLGFRRTPGHFCTPCLVLP